MALFSLGGTIAMADRDGADGAHPALDAAELVAAVPGLAAVADVTPITFRQVPGAHLRFHDLVALAGAIREQIDAGADGVVVVQGTDTIEETAFALELLLDVRAPVVVTGAMRPADHPGADGPANLIAATHVATSMTAAGLGVLVVFDGEIHAARFVQKRHPFRAAAFRSVGGPVGWVAEGRVRVLSRPPPVPSVQPSEAADEPRVPLVTVTWSDDGSLIQHLVTGDHDGVVIEALGAGHVPTWLVDDLAALAARKPVVLASRTGDGEPLSHTYGFPGSEQDLLSRGLLRAGWLDGPKARVLLMMLCAARTSHAEVREALRLVDEHGLDAGHAPVPSLSWERDGPTGDSG